MTIHLANAERLAMEALANALRPPPPVDYLAWAEANIVFSKRESQDFPGPYNRALFPFFDEILRALGPDDPCRIVTLAKSAQLGGTVLANVFTLGSLVMAGGDFLYIHPTEDNAARWSKTKLSPMLRGAPAVARLFPSGKSRDGSDSILFKERLDKSGALQISGANSPSALSMITMPRQVQDDLAKWELNAAGDPEGQADRASMSVEFAKVFKVSTPLVLPGCRITKAFTAGSQEHPEVPCPHCDAFQVLEWDNMLAVLDEAAPERAHFTCVECGAEILEHHRPAMVRRMRWTARNPAALRHHRSFWIWSAYSPLQSWERIARAWVAAKGDAASEQTFQNNVLGLAYRGAGEAVAWEQLRDRAAVSPDAIGQIPRGGLIVTIGVDCQGNRVEWQAKAYGREHRSWVIAAGVFPGHISTEPTRQLLDALLAQTWPNAVGRRLGVDLLAIDGNAWTEDVWGWVRKHPAHKVIMVRGANSENAPLLEKVRKERRVDGTLLKYSSRFFNFGSSVMKMALYRNLARTDPLERGFIGLPRGLDDEFFRQLTAERRQAKKTKSGFMTYGWVKDPAQANEALDTHLQADAAALRLGLRSLPDARWDTLELERETPPPADPQGDLEALMSLPLAPAPQAAPETPNPVRPGSDWIDAGKEWL